MGAYLYDSPATTTAGTDMNAIFTCARAYEKSDALSSRIFVENIVLGWVDCETGASTVEIGTQVNQWVSHKRVKYVVNVGREK